MRKPCVHAVRIRCAGCETRCRCGPGVVSDGGELGENRADTGLRELADPQLPHPGAGVMHVSSESRKEGGGPTPPQDSPGRLPGVRRGKQLRRYPATAVSKRKEEGPTPCGPDGGPPTPRKTPLKVGRCPQRVRRRTPQYPARPLATRATPQRVRRRTASIGPGRGEHGPTLDIRL